MEQQEKAAAVDLSAYELADTAVLTVRNKKRDDVLIGSDGVNPVTIRFYGPGSKQGVRARHKAERQRDLRTFRMMRGDRDPNEEQRQEEEIVDRLVMVTAEVNNFFGLDAKQLFGNPKLIYIRNQAVEFQANEGNF